MNLVDMFIQKVSLEDGVYVRGLNPFVRQLVAAANKQRLFTYELERIIGIKEHSINWWFNQGLPLAKLERLNEVSLQILKKPIPRDGFYFSFKGSTHDIKIPNKLSRELAYVVGYLFGDGTLSSYRKCPRVEFYDVSSAFLENVAFITKELFNITNCSIRKDKRKECHCLRFNSRLLTLFFNRVFEVPIGRKSGKLHIPTLIRNSQFIKEFISGFFDAEGHVYYTPRYGYRITLTQFDSKILEEIMACLHSLGIKSIITNYRKGSYELRITNKENFKKFVSLFHLKHPDKVSRIKLAMDSKSTVLKPRKMITL